MFTVAGETVTLIDIGLFAIFLLVLTLPFKIKVVENNLEDSCYHYQQMGN